jgi:ketosteroid isomerase-like protein
MRWVFVHRRGCRRRGLVNGLCGRRFAPLVAAARVAQNRAIAAGDLDLVASFWTDDVTVRRALGQPLSGRAAAVGSASNRPALRRRASFYQRLTREIDVSPNWPLAFETGTWEGHRAA